VANQSVLATEDTEDTEDTESTDKNKI